MPKRRTYEQKLLDDVRALPADRWFDVSKKTDYEKIIEHMKIFIDVGEPFKIKEGYKSIMRYTGLTQEFICPVDYSKMDVLPEGVTVERTAGMVTIYSAGTKNSSSQTVECAVPLHNEVRFEGRLIAIENL